MARVLKNHLSPLRSHLMVPGDTSQNLCHKLSQCTTRVKITESSACCSINQSLNMCAWPVQQPLSSFNKGHFLNSWLMSLHCWTGSKHSTFRPNSFMDYKILRIMYKQLKIQSSGCFTTDTKAENRPQREPSSLELNQEKTERMKQAGNSSRQFSYL